MARVQRFGVGQTAIVLGILYALMGLVIAPFFLIAALAAPDSAGFGLGFALVVPVLYGVGGFIFTAIGCLLYNLVAGWVGGIEVEIDEAVD